MLQLDAVQLYDLSEAGRLLYRDPVRLAREARLRKIPSARAEQELGLPAPWVEAESGTSPADPEALRTYWLARLAPPSPDAWRPLRARERLLAEDLLPPDEAARRVFATTEALRRMDVEGTLPSVRVDGRACYDAQLTDLVAREAEGADVRQAAEARRSEILQWARFEYETEPEPLPETRTFEAVRTAEPSAPTEDAPAAYEIPSDLLESIDPPPSRLIETEGFETVDED